MFSCRKLHPTPGYVLTPTLLSFTVHLRSRLACRYNSTDNAAKPFYITTPIFYPNARPHIGHLYTLVTADVIARFQRILHPSRPVVFLTGTDEHGLKIQQTAQEKETSPLEWCNTISLEFRKLAQRASISSTLFMRTTQKRHKEVVKSIWSLLVAQGLIYRGAYEGYYSMTDECFYPQSRVSPHPTLQNTMIATETGSIVEWYREVNFKFRLSSFREALLAHYTNAAALNAQIEDSIVTRGVHPDIHQISAIRDLESEPLEDLSVSRPRERIGWGIAVPDDPTQTVYVWFDALLVYLSGVGYPESGSAWPPDVQVVGKDIVRFHAVYLPAILKALNLPIPKTLLAHAHWTTKQRKMSKSLGNVTDPIQVMDDFGEDAVRFYLARVGGRWKDDIDWSEEQLHKYTAEIRNLLGNYFLRVTSKAIKDRVTEALAAAQDVSLQNLLSQWSKVYFSNGEGRLVDMAPDVPYTVQEFLPLLDNLGNVVSGYMKNLEVAESLHSIVQILQHANSLLTNLAPWSDAHPPATALWCYLSALETLRIAGILLQPFVPRTAEMLLETLGIPRSERSMYYARIGSGSVGGGNILEVKGVKLFMMPRKR